jgi:hypothetical protein
MTVGHIQYVDLNKGCGCVIRDGGGSLPFLEEDVAVGYSLADLKGKTVTYSETLDGCRRKRHQHHAKSVKPV